MAAEGQREGSRRPWLWHRCRCRGRASITARREESRREPRRPIYGPLLFPPEKGGEGEGEGGENTNKRALPDGQSPQPPTTFPFPLRPARPPIPPTRCSCQALEADRWGRARPGVMLCHTPRTGRGGRTPTGRRRPARPQISHRRPTGGAAEPSGLRRGHPLWTRGGGGSSARRRGCATLSHLSLGWLPADEAAVRAAAARRACPQARGRGSPSERRRCPPLPPLVPDPRAHPPTASTHIPAAATGACRRGLPADPALPVDRRLRFHAAGAITKRRAPRTPPSLASAPGMAATQSRHACGAGGGGRAGGADEFAQHRTTPPFPTAGAHRRPRSAPPSVPRLCARTAARRQRALRRGGGGSSGGHFRCFEGKGRGGRSGPAPHRTGDDTTTPAAVRAAHPARRSGQGRHREEASRPRAGHAPRAAACA